MNKKFFSAVLLFLFVFASFTPASFAVGLKEGGASLFLPTTGQAMNGQLGRTKTKVMAGLEVAAVTTVALLGVTTGGGIVWLGLAPLIGNHLWSAADAYKGAKDKNNFPEDSADIRDAQRTIEFSRQKRFDREQSERSDFRDRMKRYRESM